MLTKVLIFGLLCSTVIQAFPTTDDESKVNEETDEPDSKPHSNTKPEPDSKPHSDSKPESGKKPDSTSVNQQIPCADQIQWFKNATLETKNEYEKYYKRFADNNINVKNLSIVKAEHQHMEELIANSLRKCDVDLKNIRVNVKDQWNICRDELKSFSIMNRNLTALTQSIRPKLIDFAKQLNLPPETIDDLDLTLGRIVNFIFIIDMGKNTFRDIHSMVKEAHAKTEDGIKLEDEYKFTEKGVEAISELKEKERIGHIEEPAIVKVAEVTLKPKKGQEVVGKVEESNLVDWDPANDNDLNDLIDFNDQDIEKSNQELEQREQQQVREQEQQHLSEQLLSTEEGNLQQKQEIEENRLLAKSRRRPEVIHIL